MESSWIKLHRKLLKKGFYKNSQYVHLWVHLLLLANYSEHEYMHDGHLIMVKEGQLITGRKQLSADTGIPETTIERILKMLENEHQIGQQKTNKYRVITILNWKEHQNRTPERTTNGQQTDTYKNDKKEKKNTYPSQAQDSEEKYETLDPELHSPAKQKKEPLPTYGQVLGIWNAYPDWKATGKTSAPVNPSAVKSLLPPARPTPDLERSIMLKRRKYSLDQIEAAVKAYIVDIANRTKDKDGYYAHRFTAYEFFTYKSTFEKYANR